MNETPTKVMPTGLHYSTDEGTTWKESSMNGFNSELTSNLSAHPSRKEMIAIGSKDGLFLSEHYGEKFSLFNEAIMFTYVTLTETGGLYANLEHETVKFTSFELGSNQEIEIQLPNNQQIEPIAYIAVNPEYQKEIIIATHNNDIYLTKVKGSIGKRSQKAEN